MIRFDDADWQRLRTDWEAWWAGTLDRPLVDLVVNGLEPGRGPARVENRYWIPAFDASTSADDIIDAFDLDLSRKAFLGDAFPRIMFNQGPGVTAMAFGAQGAVGRGTVWFHPETVRPVTELDFRHPDPAQAWLERQSQLIAAAGRRWGASVQVEMTDLGGVLDVMQVFRPGEGLLLDLYDEPEAVQERITQIEAGWWQVFDRFDAAIRAAGARSWGHWGGLYSERTSYLFQCDFAYMISPAQFRRFVLPTLRRDFARVERPFYHLDGVGQLPHLDLLLAEPRLAGVQWVPGAGQPRLRAWADVVRRIRAAGKRCQVVAPPDGGDPLTQFEELVDELGDARGLHVPWCTCAPHEADDRLRRLERLGVPVREIRAA
jgi:5-methyltetrahydrofolate--homocysteine methyltransferase